MSNTLQLRSLLLAGVSLATCVWSSPALAQAEAQASVVEELIVTAQKKAEAIQDVPIAVSAFSQDNLEKAKIDGGPNLVLAIPNVNFSKANTGYNFQIRGIGTKLTAPTGDSGTGIHLNNAPLVQNTLLEAEFYDVQRVEVLRGPQGTLYGRNATGGVVNILTARPEDDFAANVRAEVGNYDSRKLRGMLNVPLGETLALRVAGTALERGGFGKNTVTNNDADDRDLWGARATLAFRPTDTFEAFLMYDRFKEEDHRSRYSHQFCVKDPGPASVGGAPFSANGVIGAIQRGFFSQACTRGAVSSPSANGTLNSLAAAGGMLGVFTGLVSSDVYAGKMQDRDLRNTEQAFDPRYLAKSEALELSIGWDVAENLKVSSLTNYSTFDAFTRQEIERYVPVTGLNATPGPNIFTTPSPTNPGLPGPAYAAFFASLFPNGVVNDPQMGALNRLAVQDLSKNNSEQWSQELRLQSDFDGAWNFNVGIIHLDYQGIATTTNMLNTATAFVQMQNLLGSLAPGGAPFPCTLADAQALRCIYIDPAQTPTGDGHNSFHNFSDYHLKSTGLFGELYWEMTEDLKWTLGLRYTIDDKHNVTRGFVPAALSKGVGRSPPIVQDAKFKEWTGRFGFDWKPTLSFTDETLVYAFASRGYKGGGFNTPCSPAPGLFCPNQLFKPEFVNAIEVGVKNTLFDGAMTFNATAFHYDYKDYQISKIVNRAAFNENIDAKVKGLEFESVWSPARGLRLNATLGYLDTEITNGSSIDNLDRTQGVAGLTLIKSQQFSNCVVSTAHAQQLLAASTATNNPFLILAGCGIVPGATVGAPNPGAGAPLVAGGPLSLGVNSLGGLVAEGVLVNLKGRQLPNSPHWTFSLGAQYAFELGHGWDALVRADYYRQSRSYARIYNSASDVLEDWHNVNATLTLTNDERGWAVEAFVKNLTDELVVTDTVLSDDVGGLVRQGQFTEPRTYGVAITKRW